jgi:hypothetical protein
MNSDQYEYNNPHHFTKKIKAELDRIGVKITRIKYDGSAFASWILELEISNSEYRFVWDNREGWLIFDQLMKKGNQEIWEEIDIYRYNQATRTEKQKRELEESIINDLLLSLDKLTQIS